MEKALLNWSGGKDSSLTLYHLLKTKEYDVKYLLTSINEKFQRISMHGVRLELLEQQAQSIGIPLRKLMVPEELSMDTYNYMMKDVLRKFMAEGIEFSVFGDIFLEDLKKYREGQLAKVNMKGVFPIWKKDTLQLAHEFIDLGFKAVIVCVDERYLDKSFVGRPLDRRFLEDLPGNVDPCGENGEYHSFVYDGPIFSAPVKIKKGEIVRRDYKRACLSGRQAADKSGHSSQVHPGQDYDTAFYYCDLESDSG